MYVCMSKGTLLEMQNVMHIATNAGHTTQNDGRTAQNDGRTRTKKKIESDN